jgi:hypothetical protein
MPPGIGRVRLAVSAAAMHPTRYRACCACGALPACRAAYLRRKCAHAYAERLPRTRGYPACAAPWSGVPRSASLLIITVVRQ